ncbi:hypothetical protein GIB67_029698 [Kingdonia uniflora]|uniref:mitogen-activated protein kinase kinase kinase n=1 Tax=Kingdonia uniflora TaxID=39325 RepID=A0A7J7LLT5_9MAGN|nr:hypothetical protein GIB67_029698 [Kingdonia uniflora]
MPWWQNTFSSSTTSSSTTSSPSPSSTSSPSPSPKQKYSFRRNWGGYHHQPRLTRQRKLRHLSDLEVGRFPLNNQFLLSENSSPVSATISPARSSSAAVVPQPLPLPESSLLSRRDSGSLASQSGRERFPLPSPKDGTAHRWSAEDGDGEGLKGRRFAYPTIRKDADHVNTSSTRSPIERGKKVIEVPQRYANIDFRLNSPARSAPASGFSSPTLSPRRMSTGDFFPSPLQASHGLQVWSAPEMPPIDMLAGFSSHASPDKFLYSPERSPLVSGVSSPLHHNHVTVHPLPLPPGPPVSQQPSFTPQIITKQETSQWQKGKLIGRGTFGSVYVGTNRETGGMCAMKEVDLIPDDPKSAECIKQLEQEITVLSQLKHSNIVQYYGSEIVKDRFYIYLEYVYPGSINKYVREHCGAITESVVRNFTRHILSGLAYLHSTKTIHRDIKGANLLVDATGVVKLADFGMAKILTGQKADLSMKGSPYWMAPEVIQAVMQKDSNGDLALAVDIWSLGCTIIEMLNGKPPWSEFEGAAAMFKVLRETPPVPETLSEAGKDFLKLCFKKNPAERPTASMLLEHRFLRSSHQPDVTACTQQFSGMKLGDVPHSPREWSKYKADPVSVSPSSQTAKGKLLSSVETGQQSHPENSDSTAASRHSPRSTLETIPSLSPPHSNCCTRESMSSPNGRSYALPACNGKGSYTPFSRMNRPE